MRHHRCQADRGAAAVEFALVLPVLVLLLFGIIEFGRGYNAKIELTGAVREGARQLALGKSTAAVQAAVISAAPGLTLTAADVTVGTACPGGDANGNATVSAQYALAYDIPLFGSGTFDIDVSGVMRCGL